MDIKFQYLPSFEKGFGIKIKDCTDKITDPENWTPTSFSFSTKTIDKAEYLLVKNFSGNPLDQVKLNASCNKKLLDTDCKELTNLLQNVSITLTNSDFVTLDGTRIFITFSDISNELTLQYNSSPPNLWQGIKKLQSFFENIYTREG